MRARCQIVIAIAFGACIAGCVTQGGTMPTASVTPAREKVTPTDPMKSAVTIGRSTRADVRAVLGETMAISFDTGYEVWVYRLPNTRTGEFVVLFAPSGAVAKTRVRPEAPSYR